MHWEEESPNWVSYFCKSRQFTQQETSITWCDLSRPRNTQRKARCDRITWRLEPLREALLASGDVIISSQIWGSELQRVFTLDDGCRLPIDLWHALDGTGVYGLLTYLFRVCWECKKLWRTNVEALWECPEAKSAAIATHRQRVGPAMPVDT